MLIDSEVMKIKASNAFKCAFENDTENPMYELANSINASILGSIDNQPCAFYKDKVVEQIEQYLFDKYCIEGDNHISEIIEKGGI